MTQHRKAILVRAFLLLLISLAYVPRLYGQTQRIEVEFEVLATVVYEGDKTLWRMAEERYGNAYLWPLIAYINRLSQDTKIPIGTTIYIPIVEPRKAVLEEELTQKIEVEFEVLDTVVCEGDKTLREMAEEHYGKGYLWPLIAYMNKFSEDTEIPAGTTIYIPVLEPKKAVPDVEEEPGPEEEESESTEGEIKPTEEESEPTGDDSDEQAEPDIEYLFQSQAVSDLEAGDVEDKEYRTVIAEQAKKQLESGDTSKEIIWSGDSCGCVLDFAEEVVYGFYPFWMADGNEQKLNFSVLSRIGYFAVVFDPETDFWEKSHWKTTEKNKPPDFLREARKYKTKVDLVIYISKWGNYDQDYFSKIAKKSAKALNNGVGNGITFYFDFNEIKDRSQFELVTLIEELSKEVKFVANGTSKSNPSDTMRSQKWKLNIMLPMNAFGEGVYSWKNLYEINEYIDLFLVFLEEPTTKTKKELRIMIESNYPGKGIERKDMLRKIVPVIPLSNFGSKQQFYDDLIYFEDNFGGVGLWPVPINKTGAKDGEYEVNDQAVEANDKIIQVFYEDEEDRSLTQRLMAIEDSWYCKIVCPNRWYFRWAMDILIGIFAVHFLLWFFILDLRTVFNHSWCFLGYSILLALIFLSLNLCDPWYAELRGLFFVLFILLLIAVLICLYIRRRKRATFP
jgi:hypothetical protein